MSPIKTLGQFIIEKQSDFPYAKGELSRLLRDIGIASKIVNREVNKAGIADIIREANSAIPDKHYRAEGPGKSWTFMPTNNLYRPLHKAANAA